MGNVTHSNHNCTMTYLLGDQTNVARLRCKKVEISYAVNSEESHARENRAFYPHRRSQGSFDLTFDFIHWGEFNSAMNWFRSYAYSILGAGAASGIQVAVPWRKFTRIGVPTKGMAFGDHTASMVFSPTISFVSIANPADKLNQNLSARPSSTVERKGQLSTTWFYPDSQMSRPGQVQKALYDQAALIAVSILEEINDTILGPPPPPPGILDPTAPPLTTSPPTALPPPDVLDPTAPPPSGILDPTAGS